MPLVTLIVAHSIAIFLLRRVLNLNSGLLLVPSLLLDKLHRIIDFIERIFEGVSNLTWNDR